MGAYSKAIGTVIGAVVGLIFVWAVSKGIASCDATGANCTVFGMSETAVTGIATSVFGTLGTIFAPKNTGT